uniref:Uncharacterized protein n=1 Tax=Peronospora matthiolae TaxID=2874970 RepID=A0AAV1TQX7_9STRA
MLSSNKLYVTCATAALIMSSIAATEYNEDLHLGVGAGVGLNLGGTTIGAGAGADVILGTGNAEQISYAPCPDSEGNTEHPPASYGGYPSTIIGVGAGLGANIGGSGGLSVDAGAGAIVGSGTAGHRSTFDDYNGIGVGAAADVNIGGSGLLSAGAAAGAIVGTGTADHRSTFDDYNGIGVGAAADVNIGGSGLLSAGAAAGAIVGTGTADHRSTFDDYSGIGVGADVNIGSSGGLSAGVGAGVGLFTGGTEGHPFVQEYTGGINAGAGLIVGIDGHPVTTEDHHTEDNMGNGYGQQDQTTPNQVNGEPTQQQGQGDSSNLYGDNGLDPDENGSTKQKPVKMGYVPQKEVSTSAMPTGRRLRAQI